VNSVRRASGFDRLLGRTETAARVPPIFVLGVVMITVVVGGLLLRSQMAAGSAPNLPPSAAASAIGGTSATASATAAVAGTTATPGASATTPTPQPSATTPYGLAGYVWPLKDPMITLPFGPTDWGEFIVDGKKFHDGLDIATNCGDPVMAAHDGTVLAASREYDAYMGWTSDFAPYYHLLDRKHWWNSVPIVVVIDDGDGYRSIYAHEYQVTVKVGQHIKAGQTIGYEGATGNATGCHVHFGLFRVTETATFALDPAVVKRMSMPAFETARIDPLLVLPFKCQYEEMRALRPVEAAPCPALPTSTPGPTKKPAASQSPSPSPSPSPTAAASA
jgi:murein DD-endopeptidase MepM/ murein hydrolase activator NlpD